MVIIRETLCASKIRRYHYVLLSFLRRTLCLSILSLCLPKDVHFQHDFQLQKTQFSQLFPALPPLALPAHSPIIFPLSGGILRARRSHSNPLRIPWYFPFQRASYADEFPSKSPLVPLTITSSRGNLQGDFRVKRLFFFSNLMLFRVNFFQPEHETGGVSGG